MHDPGVHSHGGACGDGAAVGEGESPIGYGALEHEADARVDAAGLEDYGVEVGEGLGGFVGYRQGEAGGVEFALEACYDAGLFEDVVEGGAEGDGCGVGAGHHLGVRVLDNGWIEGGGNSIYVDHEPADDLLVGDPGLGTHFLHEIVEIVFLGLFGAGALGLHAFD